MPIPPPSAPSFTALFQASDVTALARSFLDDLDNVAFQDPVLLPLLSTAYRDLQRELYIRGKVGETYAYRNITIPIGVTVLGDAVDANPMTAISRAANVVTMVTQGAHGLVDGMAVRVAGVSNATFDGQFLITVVDSVTFTYEQTGANVVIAIAPGATDGTTTIDPALPLDFAYLDALKERGDGTTEYYTEVVAQDDFLQVDYTQSSQMRYFNQGDGLLNFIGATRAIELRLKYAKLLDDVTVATDYIRLRGSLDALAYMTAAMAARSRGTSGKQEDFTANANRAIDGLVTMFVRPRQRQPKRRKPYGARRRVL